MIKMRVLLYAVVTVSGFLGFVVYAVPMWAAIYFLVATAGLLLMLYEAMMWVRYRGVHSILPPGLNRLLTQTPLLELIRQAYYAMRNTALGATALVASFTLPEIRAHEAEQLTRCLPPAAQRTLLSPLVETMTPEVRAVYTGSGNARHPSPAAPELAQLAAQQLNPAEVAVSILAGRVGWVVNRYGAPLLSGVTAMCAAVLWIRRRAPGLWNRSRIIRVLIVLATMALGAQLGVLLCGQPF